MQIAVLTFDGFNELDSFVAAAILNRLHAKGWAAHITSPTPEVTSMNGLVVRRQKPLAFASEADAVIIGSGRKTREIASPRSDQARSVAPAYRRSVFGHAAACEARADPRCAGLHGPDDEALGHRGGRRGSQPGS